MLSSDNTLFCQFSSEIMWQPWVRVANGSWVNKWMNGWVNSVPAFRFVVFLCCARIVELLFSLYLFLFNFSIFYLVFRFCVFLCFLFFYFVVDVVRDIQSLVKKHCSLCSDVFFISSLCLLLCFVVSQWCSM